MAKQSVLRQTAEGRLSVLYTDRWHDGRQEFVNAKAWGVGNGWAMVGPPGRATEGQAFFLLMEAAHAKLSSINAGTPAADRA